MRIASVMGLAAATLLPLGGAVPTRAIESPHAVAAAVRDPAVPDQATVFAQNARIATAAPAYALTPFALYRSPPQWMEGNSIVFPEWSSAIVADVTRDGRDDVVLLAVAMPSPANTRVQILEQSPSGELFQTAEYPLATMGGNVGMTAADMNEDGLPDIVVTQQYGIAMLLSRQDGTFSTLSQDGQAGYHTVAAVAVDANNDGHLDLVSHVERFTGNAPMGLAIYHNDGTGTIVYRDLEPLDLGPDDFRWMNDLVAADLNGDGLTDLAATYHDYLYGPQASRFVLAVRYHNPGYGFGPPVPLDVVGYGGHWPPEYSAIAAGDVNRDGRVDLIAATYESMLESRRLSTFVQEASGQLRKTGVDKTTEPLTSDIVVADLNHDGGADVLTAHSGWLRLGYYLQQEASFAGPVVVPAGASQSSGFGKTSMSVGDLNGDNCPDVAIAGRYDLTILHGSGCTRRPALSGRQPAQRADIGAQATVTAGIGAEPPPRSQATAETEARPHASSLRRAIPGFLSIRQGARGEALVTVAAPVRELPAYAAENEAIYSTTGLKVRFQSEAPAPRAAEKRNAGPQGN